MQAAASSRKSLGSSLSEAGSKRSGGGSREGPRGPGQVCSARAPGTRVTDSRSRAARRGMRVLRLQAGEPSVHCAGAVGCAQGRASPGREDLGGGEGVHGGTAADVLDLDELVGAV